MVLMTSSFLVARAKVSAGFTIVSGLAVAAFDLVYCSLSVFRSVFVPDINKQSSQSSDQLWATRRIQRGAGIRAIVSDVQPKIWGIVAAVTAPEAEKNLKKLLFLKAGVLRNIPLHLQTAVQLTYRCFAVFPLLISSHSMTFEYFYWCTCIRLWHIQTVFLFEYYLAFWRQYQHL